MISLKSNVSDIGDSRNLSSPGLRNIAAWALFKGLSGGEVLQMSVGTISREAHVEEIPEKGKASPKDCPAHL